MYVSDFQLQVAFNSPTAGVSQELGNGVNIRPLLTTHDLLHNLSMGLEYLVVGREWTAKLSHLLLDGTDLIALSAVATNTSSSTAKSSSSPFAPHPDWTAPYVYQAWPVCVTSVAYNGVVVDPVSTRNVHAMGTSGWCCAYQPTSTAPFQTPDGSVSQQCACAARHVPCSPGR